MKIEIDTDGTPSGTRVFVNGHEKKDLLQFEFSVSTIKGRAGQACLATVRGDSQTGKPLPDGFSRLFGKDIMKYDEHFPPQATPAGAGEGSSFISGGAR